MDTLTTESTEVSITATSVAELATRLRAIQQEHNVAVRRKPFESDIDKALAAERSKRPLVTENDGMERPLHTVGTLSRAIASMSWGRGRPLPPDVAAAIAAQSAEIASSAETAVTDDVQSTQPPTWCEYGLYLLLPKKHRDNVPGDLREEFETDILPRFGRRAANLWYIKESAVTVAALLPRRWRALLWLLIATKIIPIVLRF